MRSTRHAVSELDRFELVATFAVTRAQAGDARTTDDAVLVPLALKLEATHVARTPFPGLAAGVSVDAQVLAVKRLGHRTRVAPPTAWPVVRSGKHVLVLANRPAPDATLAGTLPGAASVTDLDNPALPNVAADLVRAAALDADLAAGKSLAEPDIRARYLAKPATLGPLGARHLCARAAAVDPATRAQLLHPLLLARDAPAPTRAALVRGVVEHATPRNADAAERAALLRALFAVLAEPVGTAPHGHVVETFLPYALATGAPAPEAVFRTPAELAEARNTLRRHTRTHPDHPARRWLGTEAE